ncbi:MAG: hypothetical protein L6365_21760 [Desulfobulbaceae bacterium]|nr:hypothetical protein [Desulfobulbaceae bacterium]
MIKELDRKFRGYFFKLGGDAMIVFRRCRFSAWMIMDHDNFCGIMVQSGFHDFPWVEWSPVNGAFYNYFMMHKFIGIIQTKQQETFPLVCTNMKLYELGYILRCGDSIRELCVLLKVSDHRGANSEQECCCFRANSFYFQKPFPGLIQNSGKRTKVIDQFLRQFFGIPARYRVCEQQLKHFIIRQGLPPGLIEPFSKPAAVSVSVVPVHLTYFISLFIEPSFIESTFFQPLIDGILVKSPVTPNLLTRQLAGLSQFV